MRFIGVDLHSNQITVCYLIKAGKEKLAPFALNNLTAFLNSLRRTDRLAVEATGNTRWFVEQIKSLVEQVVVVNPNQFEVIRRSVKKTDCHNARALAQFLSKEMLPEARMKSEQASEINSLATTRDKLVKLRTTLVNKLHALCRVGGIKPQEPVPLQEGDRSSNEAR